MSDVVASAPSAPVRIDVADCKVTRVVVYRDQAEVTRLLEVHKPAGGDVALEMAGITSSAGLESVCVKPLESGQCTILEVSYENMVRAPVDSELADSDNIKAEIEAAESERAILQRKKSRIENSIALAKSYAKTQLESKASDCSVSSVEFARSVILFSEQEGERLDMELLTLLKENEKVDAKIDKLKAKQAAGRRVTSNSASSMCQLLHINVNVKDGCESLRILVSYVVKGATWSPLYDVRVTTAPEESLSLSYFAEVTQWSGEDWNDCDLCLSTSNPAISADPPSLKSKYVNFHYPSYNYGRKDSKNKSKKSSFYDNEDDGESSYSRERSGSFALAGNMDAFPMMQQMALQDVSVEFEKAAIQGSGDAGSTIFTITRKVTIASDHKAHKVMITARSFRPQLVHYCVPSVSPFVYIQAKTKNSSGYPLLASSKVNIYLDGNFISKSSMKQANTGEMFLMFIGMDPSVKVEYLPTKYEEYKRGWVSGSEVKKVFHKTTIHNTKGQPCRIIFTDALPISTVDKISVELLEPSPSSLTDASAISFSAAEDAFSALSGFSSQKDGKEPDRSAAGNDASATATQQWPSDFVTKNKTTNSIVWFKTIRPGEKIEVPFSYRMEWPQGSQVHVHDA